MLTITVEHSNEYFFYLIDIQIYQEIMMISWIYLISDLLSLTKISPSFTVWLIVSNSLCWVFILEKAKTLADS